MKNWLDKLRDSQENIRVSLDCVNYVLESLERVGLYVPCEELNLVKGLLSQALLDIDSAINLNLNEMEENSNKNASAVLLATLSFAEMLDSSKGKNKEV